MKINKLFLIPVAVFIAFCQSFSVNALSAEDLLSENVPYFYAAKTEGKGSLDGILSHGEYADSNCVILSEGLNQFEIVHSETPQTSSCILAYIGYDADFLRIGIQMGEGVGLSTVTLDDGSEAYSVGIRVGLNSSFPDCFSYLENQYLFSKTNFTCVGVVGTRVVHFGTERKFVGTVSTLNPETERPYTDAETGILWNGKTYSSNAVLSSASRGDKGVFECRIPMGDLMQTALHSPLDGDGFIKAGLCGGFSFSAKITSNQNISGKEFTCGILASEISPISDDGATWKEYLSALTGIKKALIPDEWMLPLSFSFVPKGSESPDPSVGDSASQEGSDDLNEDTSHGNALGTTDAPTPSAPLTSSGIDPFFGLPQIDNSVSENSEIVYHESDAKDEETNRGLASALLLIAGVFLFVSVIGTAFLFRYMEQKEKNDKVKKKTNKKS